MVRWFSKHRWVQRLLSVLGAPWTGDPGSEGRGWRRTLLWPRESAEMTLLAHASVSPGVRAVLGQALWGEDEHLAPLQLCPFPTGFWGAGEQDGMSSS